MMSTGANGLIDAAILTWLVMTGFSTLYVAWDAFMHNPEMTVMKWGWVLVTLYTGPVGLSLYILSCREPAPGQHEELIKPLWKQGLGSLTHCLAGDATGIIVSAAVTAALGFPTWLDIILEYAFGFGFGLLIFQALFLKDMMGGSYSLALKRAFLPEWLSMNCVMAGMIPVMVILMSRDPASMEASSLRFWGIMSLAILVGGVVAYPINVWLVSVHLKEGMGTVRALGKGGQSLAAGDAASPSGGSSAQAQRTGEAMKGM